MISLAIEASLGNCWDMRRRSWHHAEGDGPQFLEWGELGFGGLELSLGGLKLSLRGAELNPKVAKCGLRTSKFSPNSREGPHLVKLGLDCVQGQFVFLHGIPDLPRIRGEVLEFVDDTRKFRYSSKTFAGTPSNGSK